MYFSYISRNIFQTQIGFSSKSLLGIYSQTKQKLKIEIRMKQNRNELGCDIFRATLRERIEIFIFSTRLFTLISNLSTR